MSVHLRSTLRLLTRTIHRKDIYYIPELVSFFHSFCKEISFKFFNFTYFNEEMYLNALIHQKKTIEIIV